MFIILLIVVVGFIVFGFLGGCWEEACRESGMRSGSAGNGTRMVGRNEPNPTVGMGYFRAQAYIKREHKKIARENAGWFLANCGCGTCVNNQRLYFKNLKQAEKTRSQSLSPSSPRGALNTWFDRIK